MITSWVKHCLALVDCKILKSFQGLQSFLVKPRCSNEVILHSKMGMH